MKKNLRHRSKSNRG